MERKSVYIILLEILILD